MSGFMGIDPDLSLPTAHSLLTLARDTDEMLSTISGIGLAGGLDVSFLLSQLQSVVSESRELASLISSRTGQMIDSPHLQFAMSTTTKTTPRKVALGTTPGASAPPTQAAVGKFMAVWNQVSDTAGIFPLFENDAARLRAAFDEAAKDPAVAKAILDQLGTVGAKKLLQALAPDETQKLKITNGKIEPAWRVELSDAASRFFISASAGGSLVFDQVVADRGVIGDRLAIALWHVPRPGEPQWPAHTLTALLERIPTDRMGATYLGGRLGPSDTPVRVPTLQLLLQRALNESPEGVTLLTDLILNAPDPKTAKRLLRYLAEKPVVLIRPGADFDLDDTAGSSLLRKMLIEPFAGKDVLAQGRAVDLFEKILADQSFAQKASSEAAKVFVEAFTAIGLRRPDELSAVVNGAPLPNVTGDGTFGSSFAQLRQFFTTLVGRSDSYATMVAAVVLLSGSQGTEASGPVVGGTLLGLLIRAINDNFKNETARHAATVDLWTRVLTAATGLAAAGAGVATGGLSAAFAFAWLEKLASTEGSKIVAPYLAGSAPKLNAPDAGEYKQWAERTFASFWIVNHPDEALEAAKTHPGLVDYIVNGSLVIPELGKTSALTGDAVDRDEIARFGGYMHVALTKLSEKYRAAILPFAANVHQAADLHG